jgi:glycosyltransferase involved in cell wall biosynthesis
MTLDTRPTISCVCVTRGKPALLKRAVECFKAQTYEQKELIILFEDDDYSSREICEQLDSLFIKVVEVGTSPKMSLGVLRNIAIEKASGEFICQWDDDDWYHSKRLEIQIKTLQEANYPGCILTNWLVFDEVHQKSFISNPRLWEGSILCRKEVLGEKLYSDAIAGEDTEVLEYLYEKNYLVGLDNPTLYIYVHHGQNTWGRDHCEFIFKCSTKIEGATNNLIAGILKQQYGPLEGSELLDQYFLEYKKRVVYKEHHL